MVGAPLAVMMEGCNGFNKMVPNSCTYKTCKQYLFITFLDK